jgi:HK97 family phage major capsid protein
VNIAAIREKRAAKVAEMRALVAKAEAEKRSLAQPEQSTFDAIKAEVQDLEGQEARAQFLEDVERRATGQRVAGTNDGNFEAECRAFSLTKAIAAQLPNSNVDAGREREISQELARRSGRTFSGIAVPTQVFEERVMTTAAPAGGPGSNIIATDYKGDLFIDRLRNAIKVRQLGATVLSNLVGNVDIPRLKGSITTGWVAENSALTASDAQFEKISLTPKHVGALAEYSRNMLQQASPDVEQLLRRDMALMLGEAVDLAAIAGTGASNQPLGILGTSGIGSVAIGTNGGPITWASVIDLIAAVENVNGVGSGFFTNTKVTKSARKTLKTTTDTASNMVMTDPNTLAGYSLQASNLVPSNLTKGTSSGVCSALIFGNWADLILGYWSELDVLVNPYESAAYSKGNVQIRAMATMDVKVRQPSSFASIQDLTTP